MLRLFRNVKHFFSKDLDDEKYENKDPISIAEELLRDMDEELSHMRESLNKQIASEKRLKRRIEEAYVESDQREADALAFLKQDDENSARIALLKKEETRRHATEMETLLVVAQSHKAELLQHIDEQIAEYDRLQEKKIELQTKRNHKRPPTVYEVEDLKVQEKRDFFPEPAARSEKKSHSLINKQDESIKYGDLKNVDEFSEVVSADEPSITGAVSAEVRLEELKKSLKQKGLGE